VFADNKVDPALTNSFTLPVQNATFHGNTDFKGNDLPRINKRP
jgi:hypothetical protein